MTGSLQISRRLVLSGLVLAVAGFAGLVAPQAASAADTKIEVNGQLGGGAKLYTKVTVGANGAVSGVGTINGMNAETGKPYSYYFYIKGMSTANGKLNLTGNFVAENGGGAVYVIASVPSGALTFTYFVNGKMVTMNGQDTVVVTK